MPASSKKRSQPNSILRRYRAFMARRPHRSFRLTRRRDYVRPLELPAYFVFVHEVNRIFWSNRKLFIPLVLIFGTMYTLLVGFVSQENYSLLSDMLQETGSDLFAGIAGSIQHAGLLVVSIASTSTSAEGDGSQQIIAGLLFMLLWLASIWLLRNRMAGHKVKLRDGLYNSGAPILPSFLLFLVIVVQLLPIAFAFLGYYAASSTGLLSSGAPAMLFWLGAVSLGVLSLYWTTSTLLAAVIVTLPGMYPLKALQTAGDLVLGRRIRILLRWVFMFIYALIAWAIIMIPLVLLEVWLRSMWGWMENVPLIPVAVVTMGVVSVVWSATYIYALYRKVVDSAV